MSQTVAAQDSVKVNKQKLDSIIQKEIDRMGKQYQNGYKKGEVTWTYPDKVPKGESIPVEFKMNGEVIFLREYDPITYQQGGIIDLR